MEKNKQESKGLDDALNVGSRMATRFMAQTWVYGGGVDGKKT